MEFLILPLLVVGAISWLFLPDDTTEPEEDTPEPDTLTEQNFGADDDEVTGTEGRDLLRLGAGNDTAQGNAGDDVIFGQAGNDEAAGGPGNDRIFLGEGVDQNFESGNADAAQLAGDDLIRGGDDGDVLIDFLGSNTIYGDLGADQIDAVDAAGEATTPDAIYGGFGPDILAGDDGDLISGGANVDTFFVALDAAPDDAPVITDYEPGEEITISVPLTFEGQDASLIATDTGTEVHLGRSVLLRLEGVRDIEDVNLRIIAADTADQTTQPGALRLGTDGDDTIRTGDGDDAVFAGRGDDLISTGDGDDYVSTRAALPFAPEGELGWGSNTVETGNGDDRILGGAGDDRADAGSGNDLVSGGGGSDILRGGDGNDLVDGDDAEQNAADRLFGGAGDDRILLDDGDIARGGSGDDAFVVAEFNAGDAPAEISDFDPDRETLDIGVVDGPLDLSFVRDGDATRVLVGDSHVLTLAGVTPEQMSGADILVRRLA